MIEPISAEKSREIQNLLVDKVEKFNESSKYLRSLTSYFLLKQDCIKLFGLTWHPDHLMCARCSKFLASKEKIFLHNDNVLCRTCISLMRSRKCFACGKVISSSNKGLHALGKEWHIACFICSVGIVLSILYAQSALQTPLR